MKKYLLLGTALLLTALTVSCNKDDNTPGDPEENIQTTDPFVFGAVDLGLSVKWANANVGADKAEACGDYFAWGETAVKADYEWTTYTLCNGDYDKLTQYCTDASYGERDGKKVLEAAHDAASVKLGGSWRMPTQDEWTELCEQCTWKHVTQNGAAGWTVTSKSNGKSIFLPAAGYYSGTQKLDAGSKGLYWSSSLHTIMPFYAWHLVVGAQPVVEATARNFGMSIRAVTE